ncbi:MAG: GNAT family N-acetyltransferase [Hymenobacter sp.]|nr:MAG: GNAT family N-acetyltransferase [Hymenobacter sp.]
MIPATPGDAPTLAALINQAYRGLATPQSWTTEAHLLEGPRISETQLADLLQGAGTMLKHLDASGKLTGCVYVQPQGPRLYLSTLAVAPTAQARGVGHHLLAHAEAYARQHGCPRIAISVLSARPELLAWYERHGYRRTGQREAFPDTTDFGRPRQPLELLTLEKALV